MLNFINQIQILIAKKTKSTFLKSSLTSFLWTLKLKLNSQPTANVLLATVSLSVNVVQLVDVSVSLVRIVMLALAILASAESVINVLVMGANVLIVNVMGNQLSAAKINNRLRAVKMKRKQAAARRIDCDADFYRLYFDSIYLTDVTVVFN